MTTNQKVRASLDSEVFRPETQEHSDFNPSRCPKICCYHEGPGVPQFNLFCCTNVALQSQRGGIQDQNEVKLCCSKEGSLNVSLVVERSGQKICQRDDLFIFQDIGISEEKIVKVELRKVEAQTEQSQTETEQTNQVRLSTVGSQKDKFRRDFKRTLKTSREP